MRFVLASASPARLHTLRSAGVEPEVRVSGVDEDEITAPSAPQLVQALATAKAVAVAIEISGSALVLGCDSMLEFEGQVLGKPATAREAIERWQQMRGKTAVLYTGHFLVRCADSEISEHAGGVASTEVRFAEVSDAEIADYVATGEPLQVAGAFTIDGLGGWYVEAINGDHHNVVGLSLPLLRVMLAELGYRVADLPASSARGA